MLITGWADIQIAMKDIPGARDVYSKALMASANAPLLSLVWARLN